MVPGFDQRQVQAAKTVVRADEGAAPKSAVVAEHADAKVEMPVVLAEDGFELIEVNDAKESDVLADDVGRADFGQRSGLQAERRNEPVAQAHQGVDPGGRGVGKGVEQLAGVGRAGQRYAPAILEGVALGILGETGNGRQGHGKFRQ